MMQVSILQAKTGFSRLVHIPESGRESAITIAEQKASREDRARG